MENTAPKKVQIAKNCIKGKQKMGMHRKPMSSEMYAYYKEKMTYIAECGREEDLTFLYGEIKECKELEDLYRGQGRLNRSRMKKFKKDKIKQRFSEDDSFI